MTTDNKSPLYDGPPLEILNPDSMRPILIIADHAGRGIPHVLMDGCRPLGLSEEAFDEHIASDIGVAGVVRELSTRLNATAILATYSRLLIDLNRPLGDPECIPTVSDGITIPGNSALSDQARQSRGATHHWPYHRAIDLHLARLRRAGPVPLLLSVHSFTPTLRTGANPRPWHVSVMATCDERLPRKIYAGLVVRNLKVGFNEPYSGMVYGYCVKVHGLAQGLPHAQIEIRQDLIATEATQIEWAKILVELMTPIIDDDQIHKVEHY